MKSFLGSIFTWFCAVALAEACTELTSNHPDMWVNAKTLLIADMVTVEAAPGLVSWDPDPRVSDRTREAAILTLTPRKTLRGVHRQMHKVLLRGVGAGKIQRRIDATEGAWVIGINPPGEIDHPVLRFEPVLGRDGEPLHEVYYKRCAKDGPMLSTIDFELIAKAMANGSVTSKLSSEESAAFELIVDAIE